ncbi:MAG: hypothetical protein L0H79_12710 [Intrasporangium sp.]|uniref:hypothetical protein n=1 Tax=Intrasporangium sp. TaxID=1925024 RepID=UPI002648430F|nr:hypothetical protein [Intrasporangium sp.]MDN5796601.1 hypothetical protein [Intrasporangium sp.]
MSADWTWGYYDIEGSPVTAEIAPATQFPTQSDAESWLGESWRDLLAGGVESVTLRQGDTLVYGPMSLRAAE